jgi:ribokinase
MIGGKGANQAVAAARLGAEVAFVGRVGRDAFGDAARAQLQRSGVHTEFLIADPESPTGAALIGVDEANGENLIMVSPGANSRLAPEDIDACADEIDGAAMIVLSLEIPIETVERAAQLAQQQGVPVVLNPAPARILSPGLLQNVAVLTPNETEAAQLLGLGPNTDFGASEMALALVAAGSGRVVVTCGATGATLAEGLTAHPLPPFRVTAVDTVAAGDCFTAALAVELGRGSSFLGAARFASAAAALKVTRPGAQAGMPTRADVVQFLANIDA